MAEPIEDFILDSVKAQLGLASDYGPFDVELLLHINSSVATLRQLNVGPESGIVVDKDTAWSALLVDDESHNLENVKGFIFLNVKMVFDSSGMPAHLISAYQKMIEETTWRINHAANPAVDNMLPIFDEEVDTNV